MSTGEPAPRLQLCHAQPLSAPTGPLREIEASRICRFCCRIGCRQAGWRAAAGNRPATRLHSPGDFSIEKWEASHLDGG